MIALPYAIDDATMDALLILSSEERRVVDRLAPYFAKGAGRKETTYLDIKAAMVVYEGNRRLVQGWIAERLEHRA